MQIPMSECVEVRGCQNSPSRAELLGEASSKYINSENVSAVDVESIFKLRYTPVQVQPRNIPVPNPGTQEDPRVSTRRKCWALEKNQALRATEASFVCVLPISLPIYE